ncbi:MAG: ABC transporter permease [Enterovibrio sp.]
MIKILLNRFYQALFVAWSVGTLTFILMRFIPGDVAYRIAAGRYGYDYVNAEAALAVHTELGLDRSAFELYFQWLWDLLHLNLGNSLVSAEPVLDVVSHHLSYSLLLAGAATLLSLFIAIPIGVYCGKRTNSWADNLALLTSIVIKAQPVFLIGLGLVILFALQLNWLPVAGFGQPKFLILPALALALSMAAMSSRMIRNSTAQVLQSPYYAFARLKGLNAEQAFMRHAQRNIALPVIAFIGIQAVSLVEGIVMIESLFSWPGVGHALSHAIFQRDVPMIQGSALLMGLLFVMLNTLVDLIQYALDPRLRLSRHVQSEA